MLSWLLGLRATVVVYRGKIKNIMTSIVYRPRNLAAFKLNAGGLQHNPVIFHNPNLASFPEENEIKWGQRFHCWWYGDFICFRITTSKELNNKFYIQQPFQNSV